MATILPQATVDALFTAFKTRFKDGMTNATKSYEKLAQIVSSSTSIEKYPILKQFPGMRKWIGPRHLKDIEHEILTVVNSEFEDSVRVSRNAIADDQYGLYGNLVQSLGVAASNVWDQLVFDALCSDPNWVDKAKFFGTTRKYGKLTISNKTTSALSATTYDTARTTMMGYVGHENEPLNVVPNILVVGPKNEAIARKIIESKTIVDNGAAVDNPYYHTAEIVVSTRLVGNYDDYWFLMASNTSLPAILLQQRELPVLTRIDSPEAEHVFKYNENLYGTQARGAACLFMPHLIYAGIL